jgi:hypothetical protein
MPKWAIVDEKQQDFESGAQDDASDLKLKSKLPNAKSSNM